MHVGLQMQFLFLTDIAYNIIITITTTIINRGIWVYDDNFTLEWVILEGLPFTFPLS